MISEIKKFSHDDIENYNKLVQSSKKIFDIGFTKLAHKPFLNIRSMIEQLPNLIKLRADKTVSSFVNKHIKHPLLRKAFSIHTLLVGGNPFSTTSIYSLIHYLEKKWGIHFCKGGTGSLVEALTELMRRQNIEIITRTDVQKLICKDNRIKSVMLDNGKILNFDHVICNVDPPIVYQQLLQEDKKYSFRTSKFFSSHLTKYSMGLYVLFFGTKKQYPEVVHHTIWLTSRFKELLKDIFDRGKITEDFSLYIHRPTATDESFAPKGCDSFYVLCPVPNLKTDINWEVEGSRLRDRIIKALSETMLPDLENQITAEKWITPVDFKKTYRCAYGAGFSIAPTLMQSAWFRYHNQDPKIKNLYFVGAGTHPGAGLPGVVSSAKVVETLIQQ